MIHDGDLRRNRSGGEKGFVICCHDLCRNDETTKKRDGLVQPKPWTGLLDWRPDGPFPTLILRNLRISLITSLVTRGCLVLACLVRSPLIQPRRPVSSAPPHLVSLCLSRRLASPSVLRRYNLSVLCRYNFWGRRSLGLRFNFFNFSLSLLFSHDGSMAGKRGTRGGALTALGYHPFLFLQLLHATYIDHGNIHT